MEASKLFASQEAEELIKKEAVKTSVPVEVAAPTEEPKADQASKPVGPTPEQIIAIKVQYIVYQLLFSSYQFFLPLLKCILRIRMVKQIVWIGLYGEGNWSYEIWIGPTYSLCMFKWSTTVSVLCFGFVFLASLQLQVSITLHPHSRPTQKDSLSLYSSMK